MDADRAQRIYFCLHKLIELAEQEAKDGTARGRIHTLVTSSEYQEMKEWLRMK